MFAIQSHLEKFSEIGKRKDLRGINRVFGSREYKKAAEEMKKYFESLGMKSYIDSVGNVHGIYYGRNPGQKEILIGSHLDTVKEGGVYDGLLGIVAGAECVAELKRENRALDYDIHVIATNGEEGNELGGTFGSRCLTGEVDCRDEEFLRKAAGYELNAAKIEAAKYDFSRAVCYLELHIEQGPFLEKKNRKIGIVTGIVGLQRYHIHIKGMSNHSGTTMMEYRQDALVAASGLILFADNLARSYPDHFVATFQKFETAPNALAVINGEADMVLECRSRQEDLMERYIEEVKGFCDRMSGVTVSMEQLVKKAPVLTDPELVKEGSAVCKERNIAFELMPSGATHDGNMFAHKVPVGMIFVPSKNGVSHSPDEWTEPEDCELGAEVLYQLLLRIGGGNNGQNLRNGSMQILPGV